MLTSKERAELRAQANNIDTTLMVGKNGVTDTVIAEAENLLTARELVKGKVLEGALMSPREVSDALCEATGADGVAVIGTKFVIYRFSEKLQEERNQSGRAKRKPTPKSKADPVGKGMRAGRLLPGRSGSSAMSISASRLLRSPSKRPVSGSCEARTDSPLKGESKHGKDRHLRRYLQSAPCRTYAGSERGCSFAAPK